MPAAQATNAGPAVEQFAAYQAAFAYFNESLFGGRLPKCFLNFSRASKAYGFFWAERWTNGGETIAEISLNPDTLDRSLIETMSTLVHEMCHLEQQAFGKPSRNGYHNGEWAKMMEAVGLIPTSTGEVGGKKTGQSMTHIIEQGGRFQVAFNAMPEAIRLPWLSSLAAIEKPKAKSSKLKYTCPGCQANVWGKEGLRIVCRECDEEFEGPDGEDD